MQLFLGCPYNMILDNPNLNCNSSLHNRDNGTDVSFQHHAYSRSLDNQHLDYNLSFHLNQPYFERIELLLYVQLLLTWRLHDMNMVLIWRDHPCNRIQHNLHRNYNSFYHNHDKRMVVLFWPCSTRKGSLRERKRREERERERERKREREREREEDRERGKGKERKERSVPTDLKKKKKKQSFWTFIIIFLWKK